MAESVSKMLDRLPPGASLYRGQKGWIVRYPRYRWFGKNKADVTYVGSYRRSQVTALQDFVKWFK